MPDSERYYITYQPMIGQELADNYEYNEIFDIHTVRSFGSLIEVLNKLSNNNILLLFDDERVVDEYDRHRIQLIQMGWKQYESERLTYYNHLVALLALLQLRERYPIQSDHDLDEEALYFTEKSYEEYLGVEDILVTREDVFKAIESINLKDKRLHIVLRCRAINDELGHYLQNEYSFITMIYTDCGVSTYITDTDVKGNKILKDYKYRRFEGQELVDNTYPRRAKRKTGNDTQKKNT